MPMTGTYIPFANLTANGSTAAVVLSDQITGTQKGDTESSVQVTLTVTSGATVAIEARLDAGLAWAAVESGIIENKIVRIGVAQAIRLTVTGYSSGTIGGGVLI
jgi:hypothetical protein